MEKKIKKEKIVKTFKSDKEMKDFLLDAKSIPNLQKTYPADKYNCKLDLSNKQVVVTEKVKKETPAKENKETAEE
jgi:hypothetical protein